MTLAKPKPPEARRNDCQERLAGRLISDPYRWMEDDTSELQTWVRGQHEHTMAQLSALPARKNIRRRLEELIRRPAMGTVIRAGGRYFFRRRLDGEELAALY